jgi:hypothetical protein
VDFVNRPSELPGQRPWRGEAQRRGREPPAVLAAPHQRQVLLHQQRGRQQWRVILRSDSVACGERRFPLSRAGEERKEAADQMAADDGQDLLPRGQRLRLGTEDGIAVVRDKLSLPREIGLVVAVDLDPCGEVELSQADGGRRRRAVKGSVGREIAQLGSSNCLRQFLCPSSPLLW